MDEGSGAGDSGNFVYVNVRKDENIQILTQDDEVVLEFLKEPNRAQKMAMSMNVRGWRR